MNKNPQLISIRLTLALAMAMAASTISSQAQTAAASLSGVQAGGNYDYTLTLHNTGTTPLNSFWYGWTTSGNNLSSFPSTAGNSLGWANNLSGNSIEWVNSTGTVLGPGQSGVFTFVATSTPAQITTLPSGQSVAYVNGIDFTQNVPGDSSSVFSPILVVPEPSSFGLLIAGSLGLLAAGWRKLR